MIYNHRDSVAEWSKVLRLGRNPKGRGFEPHRCHLCGRSFGGCIKLNSLYLISCLARFYSVVVITVDFDSTNTGSNPVRTLFNFPGCLHLM